MRKGLVCGMLLLEGGGLVSGSKSWLLFVDEESLGNCRCLCHCLGERKKLIVNKSWVCRFSIGKQLG